jgi:hypothetical protein
MGVACNSSALLGILFGASICGREGLLGESVVGNVSLA